MKRLLALCAVLLSVCTTSAVASIFRMTSIPQISPKTASQSTLQLVGFGSPRSAELKDKIRDRLENDSVRVVEESWGSLSPSCGAVVLFVDEDAARGDVLLQRVQAVLDRARVGERHRLAVLFDGTPSRGQRELQKTIHMMAAAANTDGDRVQVIFSRVDDEFFFTRLQEMVHHSPDKAIRSPVLPSRPRARSPTADRGRDAMRTMRIDTLREVESLVDSFSSTLRRELGEIDFVRTASNASLTRELLLEAIESANAFHHAEHVETFDKLMNSDAMNFAAQRARLILFKEISEMNNAIIDTLSKNLEYSFEKRVLRIPGGPNLNLTLNKLVQLATQRYASTLGDLNKVLNEAINLQLEEGLLGIKYGQNLEIPVDLSFQFERMETSLSIAAERRVKEMSLDGSHNPYIRSSPFPPTHVNINYMFNPRTIIENIEINRLYDQHKPGFAAGRAEPMIFPGVASIPFDPNEYPLPKERTTFWQSFRNYFMGENEE